MLRLQPLVLRFEKTITYSFLKASTQNSIDQLCIADHVLIETHFTAVKPYTVELGERVVADYLEGESSIGQCLTVADTPVSTRSQ